MHKTRFCDLQLLGVGYLYCHQGDCKHIIVIRDMRLIHPEDNLNMLAYPIRTFQLKLRSRKCPGLSHLHFVLPVLFEYGLLLCYKIWGLMSLLPREKTHTHTEIVLGLAEVF